MTVFKPQSPSEPFGTRFWSSQLVRYAAYKDSQTGSIMGDKANLELTEYLIDNYLWTPPDKLTPFDVLPWVLKVPGKKTPIVKYVPNDCIFEVTLEHPSIPELSSLDLRWTTVPAISNFKMNLGGVVYQNIPFNGWFVTTEIVRNLMERYDVGPDVARVIGLDIKTDPMWRQTASCELERMVNYSFQKNGFTIVDPMTVGRSFCTHVQREREQFGRECPAQWSWIGGLVGPTNPTWHLEMRDFLVNPQYEYCAEGLLLHTAANEFVDDDATQASGSTQNSSLLLSTRRSPSSLSLSSLGRSGSSSSLSSLGDSTKSLASLSRQEIPNVLIVYGSETGNAEAVARRLKTDLRLVSPILRPLNEVKGLDIIKKRKITHVLAVCSTFGEGAPPANAEEFFHADIQPVKREASFSVLALGSSIYPSFCQAGVDLDKILEQAGHQRAAQIMKADDATGSESTIDDWLKLVKNIVLPASLQQYLIELDLISDSGPPTHNLIWLPPDETSQCPTIQNTFERTAVFCTLNTELVAPGAAKSVRKISFQAPAPYESGDHLSVLPLNSEAIVRRFLHCFEAELMGAGFNRGAKSLREQLACIAKQPFDLEALDGDTVEPADVFFETPTTLEYILKAKVDLSLKAKDVPDLLRLLKRTLEEKLGMISEAQGASLSSTPDFQELFSLHKKILQCHPRKRTNVMDDFIASYPTIVGFFERFKAILLQKYFDDKPVLRLAEVLVILSRLQPRHYSISSSNNMNPKEISITVGVLNVETSKGVMIEGVCSNYLATLRGGKDKACIAVHKSSFRLPKDHQAPIIMVGAGTGLSPMMGFLEDRALDKKNGKSVGVIHLFFGCRSEKDFIYKDQIRKWDKEGLMRCHLALSRLTGRKQYVQDKICEFGKDIADLLLRDDTHYYVCGDARMANACYEVCVGLLREYGNISRLSSKQHLKKMRLAGRWQSDVWGIVSNYEDARKDVRKTRKTLSNEWIAQFEELEDADFTEVDDDEELSFSF